MEYFGDPDIVPYSPYNSCGKPQVFTSDKEIGGHSLNIVVDHPGKTPGFETVLIILVFALFCMIGMRKPR